MPVQPASRLAPSPTGALHLGNARTFLVNWALARQRGWRLVLRIEDLDTPRVKPGVLQDTVRTLGWLGVDWDEGPIVQSHDIAHHRTAMEQLAAAGLVYPNDMTRKELLALEAQGAPNEGHREAAFPASLRPPEIPSTFADVHAAWRFCTPAGVVAFDDGFAGPQRVEPARSVGDFVVWTRRDPGKPGQPAYQLAVVVDDHRQGVTHVVRGDDLIDSAGRQILLRHALGMGPPPAYFHLPLVRGVDGRRLAKRHGDTRLDAYRARGVAAERVVGLVAFWSGVSARREHMSAAEFLERFDLRTMPRTSATFTPEDDAWLIG
ncbi:MAG TPA: glutamate--tRNA ligase family protein [Phycisphaerales bacterium]|nr:glutamate--tRNA ligase family protein [Phycisphaerales bacterium]